MGQQSHEIRYTEWHGKNKIITLSAGKLAWHKLKNPGKNKMRATRKVETKRAKTTSDVSVK